MELLQCQAKEFDLHLINNREPLKISGSKNDGLKTLDHPRARFTNHRGKKRAQKDSSPKPVITIH